MQSSYKISQSPEKSQSIELITNKYLKELILLDKIYKHDDKFSGTGNNFYFKVTIFYNKCRGVKLSPNTYIYDTLIMLFG